MQRGHQERKTNIQKSSRSWLSLGALTGLAVLFWLVTQTIYGATATECQQAWNSAPAKAWCWLEDVDVNDSNQCRLELGCGTTSDRPTRVYNGSVSNVKKLRFCSQGGDNGYLTTNSSC